MTIIRHELKQGRKAFIIWTASIAFMLVICVIMFPEMKGELDKVSDLYSSMGSLTEAFGMDQLNYGTLIGFYAIECGNIFGLCGALFAALIAISILAKEEKNRTAEFLLSHPLSRLRIVSEKLAAVIIEIVTMNVIIYLVVVASVKAIGEVIPWRDMILLHLSYLFMQIEIAGICFGISAFIHRGSLGIGIGLATVLYFFNIVANISDSAKFLKYITPFAYTEGADIVSNRSLDITLLLLGLAYTVIFVVMGYTKFCKKDIR